MRLVEEVRVPLLLGVDVTEDGGYAIVLLIVAGSSPFPCRMDERHPSARACRVCVWLEIGVMQSRCVEVRAGSQSQARGYVEVQSGGEAAKGLVGTDFL